MRIIVHGVGAVGGTVAAGLALAGQEVVGIARGRQLAAIRQDGLTLVSPEAEQCARFDCVGDPSELTLRDDDVILLTTKTQDTPAALAQLRAAGIHDQAIFCAQNGVENERLAARLFPNVHAVTVMLPAEYTEPGRVLAYGTPRHGIFEFGRYPGGLDATDEAVARILSAGGVECFTSPAPMEGKYGKLLMNLGNIVEAALGRGDHTAPVTAKLRAEGAAILEAAGIAWRDAGDEDGRRKALMQPGEIAGARRIGSSSTQSLARGSGSIETDYLNGEIALLARLHGTEAPLNAWFAATGARLAREGRKPGCLTLDDVRAALGDVF